MNGTPRPATRHHTRTFVALLIGIGVGVALDRAAARRTSSAPDIQCVPPRLPSECHSDAGSAICQENMLTERCLSSILDLIASPDHSRAHPCLQREEEWHLISRLADEQRHFRGVLEAHLDERWGSARPSAAWLLGELYGREAVPLLLDHIDLEDRRVCIESHLLPIWHQWPAVDALVKIGKPASELAIERLAYGVPERWRDFAFMLIWRARGGAEGTRDLEDAQKREKDESRRGNLAAATALFRQRVAAHVQDWVNP